MKRFVKFCLVPAVLIAGLLNVTPEANAGGFSISIGGGSPSYGYGGYGGYGGHRGYGSSYYGPGWYTGGSPYRHGGYGHGYGFGGGPGLGYGGYRGPGHHHDYHDCW